MDDFYSGVMVGVVSTLIVCCIAVIALYAAADTGDLLERPRRW